LPIQFDVDHFVFATTHRDVFHHPLEKPIDGLDGVDAVGKPVEGDGTAAVRPA